MPTLEFFEKPSLKRTIFLAAWAGWPDAAESATRAARELVRQLPATKFASIDPEEFYDFSEQRPEVETAPDGSRTLSWPSNEFYYWKNDDPEGRDVVILVGTEPNLRWRLYAEQVTTVISECNAELMITLGALLDSVPHTRSPRVTGSSVDRDLGEGFETVQYPPPTYEGPSGMTSVISEALAKVGVKHAGIWGHAPHYVQVAHNPAITVAILKEVQRFLPKQLDLAPMEQESEEFVENLQRALEDQKDIEGYVRQLEERYDSEEERRGRPEPAELVQELEEFLRSQRQDDSEEDGKGQA